MDLVPKILLLLNCLGSVLGHVCILKERLDTTTERVRWSLPSKERCYCQIVATIKNGKGPTSCNPEIEEAPQDIWFTDYSDNLSNRLNWNKDKLDQLLDRDILCDHENPVIQGTFNNLTLQTVNGAPTADVTWIEPTAVDNSGYQTLTSSNHPGESFQIGVTMVNYTSVDRSGNMDSRVFYVTIEDNENPVIQGLPSDITQNTDNGLPTANVSWIEPTANDNSGLQTLTRSHISGEPFPIGVTVVECSSIDPSGNAEVQSFTITINDNENPVIQGLPSDITQNTDNGLPTANVNWIEPTANDNSGLHTLTCSHSPGEPFSIGVTVVEYTSIDPSGNAEVQSFTITINDIEIPTIVGAPNSGTVSGAGNSPVTWTAPTSSDNSGLVTLTSSHSPGALFPLGETLVTYTAMDDSGNQASHTFTVTMRDYYRTDLRCGSSVLAPNGEEAKCLQACCSWGGWCGTSYAHCVSQLYRDYRCCVGQSCTTC